MSTSASPTEPTAQTNQDTDAMEAMLRQAAHAVDRGDELKAEEITSSISAAEQKGKKTATAEGSERKTDAEAPSTEAEKKAAEDPQAKGEKKDDKKEEGQESAYARAKKENERFDRNWKKFQEQQEAWKQQVAQKERELAEREQRLSSPKQAEGPAKDRDGHTAADWDRAAAAWEKEGKYDLAEGAKQMAANLRDEEKRGAQPDQQERGSAARTSAPEETPGTPQFNAKWNGHLTELMTKPEFADLGKPDSELNKATATILASDPRFRKFSDGIVFAAELARARMEAASASALRQQIQQQSQELEKLRKAVSPGGAETAEERGGVKAFEDMSPAEQEAQLARAAREVDANS